MLGLNGDRQGYWQSLEQHHSRHDSVMTMGSSSELSMTTCLMYLHPCTRAATKVQVTTLSPEQGIKLLRLLLTGSTGQRTASRNGLA